MMKECQPLGKQTNRLDKYPKFANFNFSSRNMKENVKDFDFEDPLHPYTRRRIMFKKGMVLQQGFFIVELSQSQNHFFISAYDLQSNSNKFVK